MTLLLCHSYALTLLTTPNIFRSGGWPSGCKHDMLPLLDLVDYLLLVLLLLLALPRPPIPSSRHRVCCCWPTWPLPAFLASGTSSRPRLVPLLGLAPVADSTPLAALLLLLPLALTAPGTCCAFFTGVGLLLSAALCFLPGCAAAPAPSCCFFGFPACRCGRQQTCMIIRWQQAAWLSAEGWSVVHGYAAPLRLLRTRRAMMTALRRARNLP